MVEYIEREAAIAIIEEKQKELCPVGRYGRGYVYGSDREKYDAWDAIIDALENIPSADVAPVVHAQWIEDESGIIIWPECKRGYNLIAKFTNYCPACGAKMDGKEGANADDHD